MKILLVEDDQSTSELLVTTLTAHRYTVDVATDGQTGLELASLWNYDVLILDVQLPKLDGISVCCQLRAEGNKTPILILTARNENSDIVIGLDSGADDYVVKPCDPSQLLARVRALLRRGEALTASPLLRWGVLSLNPAAAQVFYQQQQVTLSPKEYKLLELFLRHPQRIFSRSAILDHLWTAADFPTENAVTNLIKDLRRKLKAAGMTEDLIETLYSLGYRLKPAPVKSPAQPAEPEAAQRHAEGILLLNQLAERFQNSLSQRLLLLEEAVQLLQTSQLSIEQRQITKEEAHRLVGVLGTYGYTEASVIARTIENLFQGDAVFQQAQIVQLTQLLTKLRQATETRDVLVAPSKPTTVDPLLLVINLDAGFTTALQQEAAVWGLQVQIVQDWTGSADPPIQDAPAVILLNLEGDWAGELGLSLLSSLKQQFPQVPILTLAKIDNLTHRIAAARLGSERYLLQPTTPTQVLEVIAQLLPQPTAAQDTVMIVDDDRDMLALLKNLLQPWNLNVICLPEAEQFWDVLTQTNPNLLLLDLKMPHYNGIELCQIVRRDAKYGDLPILVVTANARSEQIQQVFDAGADDLIYKPVVGADLVTRVLKRIERSRLRHQISYLQRQQTQNWQYQSRIDALTQIANRRRFDEVLSQEWQYHSQHQSSLSLILGDVDFFKSYNDYYGHSAGDACLQQLAEAIQSSIKPTQDLVARYGGEEFGIILPNTAFNGAIQVAERIQQAIAHLQLRNEALESPHVTISLGISSTVPGQDRSVEDLVKAADEALYAAKRRGRNTYCFYPL